MLDQVHSLMANSSPQKKKGLKFTTFNVTEDQSDGVGMSPMTNYLIDEPDMAFSHLDKFLLDSSDMNRATSMPSYPLKKALTAKRIVDGKRQFFVKRHVKHGDPKYNNLMEKEHNAE